MSRPTLSSQARGLLLSAAGPLDRRPVRFTVLGVALTLVVVLHLVLRDPTIAWAAVPIAVLAGLAGGRRSPIVVSSIAAAAHLGVDLWLGPAGAEIPGLVVRTIVLPGLALVGMATQLSERQRDTAMHRAVSEDPVTGLLNVRAFYAELATLRSADRPFTILLADIRGMRALNERYGHPTGTEAMRALAHVLRREAGTDVLASRLGSDEMAVAFVDEGQNRTRSVIDGIIRRLHDEQVVLPDGERFEVHAAYGIARFPEDGADEVAVLRAADRAKEQAKIAGLDQIGSADGEVS
ncbi:MAG: GGDEF domain-containing protein [Nitriliruptoraceae bacterium]